MEFLFAPMEGVTYAEFRRVHRERFPGIAEYYTPFLAPNPTGDFRKKFLRELTVDRASGARVIPQILANSAEAFLITADTLGELGFDEVNLNAGCPSGTVVGKHKGAGMLADPAALDAFLEQIFSKGGMKISVKTRMGYESTEEFAALMEIYRRYPLSRLIVHARDRKGQYKSVPDLAGFAALAGGCPFPVTYNGDVFTPEALQKVKAAAPWTQSVMLGRGLVEDPALARLLSGGAPLSLSELTDFHDALLAAYLGTGLSPNYAVERMKGIWYYIRYLFPESKKERKQLLKGKTLEEYRTSASRIFDACRFDPTAGFVQE